MASTIASALNALSGRLVPLDVGALQLPDLALHGRRALDAARRHGPLSLRAPRGLCERFRAPVVRLLRQVLHPEAVGLVDVDLVLGLGRGLTAWLADREAMRLAMYDVLLALETVAWVKPGWVELVRGFADDAPNTAGEQALVPVSQSVPVETTAGHRIALYPERSDPTATGERRMGPSRDSLMPALMLSERTKRKLLWLSEEISRSLDDTVMPLISTLLFWRRRGGTFDQLRAIAQLREQCEIAEVDVKDLRQFLELLGKLRRRGLQADDVPAALQVAEDLAQVGLMLPEARAVADLMAALGEAGVDPSLPGELQTAIEQYRRLGYAPEALARMAVLAETLETLGLRPEELGPVLEHLEQLRALGLDADAAQEVAGGLDAAGIQGERRTEILAQLPEAAATLIEIDTLEARRRAVVAELQGLEAQRTRARQTLTALRQRQAAVVQREQASAARRDTFEEECLKQQVALAALQQQVVEQQDALAAAEALTRFMVGQPDADTILPFLTYVVKFKQFWRGQWPEFEASLTEQGRRMIREFLERIALGGRPPGASRQV